MRKVTKVPKVLRAERLELVDSGCRIRARIGPRTNRNINGTCRSYRLEVFDSNGAVCASVSVDDDGSRTEASIGREGSAHVELYASKYRDDPARAEMCLKGGLPTATRSTERAGTHSASSSHPAKRRQRPARKGTPCGLDEMRPRLGDSKSRSRRLRMLLRHKSPLGRRHGRRSFKPGRLPERRRREGHREGSTRALPGQLETAGRRASFGSRQTPGPKAGGLSRPAVWT
jgi:hypothetical protein